MIELVQSESFRRWEARLPDRIRALIAARLMLVARGTFGDLVPVGDGISELRLHFGPGYRLYLLVQQPVMVVLLCGGDKSSQSRDIRLAKRLALEWRILHG